MKLFLAPHNDDETLFGAFTIMRERPVVLVVFDSVVQPVRGHAGCVWDTRRRETLQAVGKLTAHYGEHVTPVEVRFAGLSDAEYWKPFGIEQAIHLATQGECVEEIFAPAFEKDGHDQHNLVAEAVSSVFGDRGVTRYATYVRGQGKTRTDKPVAIESGEWISRKHRALACYKSQINNPELGCQSWFTGDLNEFYF